MKFYQVAAIAGVLALVLTGCTSEPTTEGPKNGTPVEEPEKKIAPFTEQDAVSLYLKSQSLTREIFTNKGEPTSIEVDGMPYYSLNEKYDTDEELRAALSEISTKEMVDTFYEDFSLHVDEDGKTYVVATDFGFLTLPDGHSASLIKGSETVKEYELKVASGDPENPDFEAITVIYEHVDGKGWLISDFVY